MHFNNSAIDSSTIRMTGGHRNHLLTHSLNLKYNCGLSSSLRHVWDKPFHRLLLLHESIWEFKYYLNCFPDEPLLNYSFTINHLQWARLVIHHSPGTSLQNLDIFAPEIHHQIICWKIWIKKNQSNLSKNILIESIINN